jgi:hypothetical protein
MLKVPVQEGWVHMSSLSLSAGQPAQDLQEGPCQNLMTPQRPSFQ